MLNKAAVLLFLVLVFGVISPLQAAETQADPKFTVLSTKFVDKVEGVNDKGEKDSWQVNDPKAGLILVMSVKAEVEAETSFLTADFLARYDRQGQPAMADCIAITAGSASQDAQGRWLIGNCGEKVCQASQKMEKGAAYFQLAFEPMEPEAKVVDLDYVKPVVKQIKIRQ